MSDENPKGLQSTITVRELLSEEHSRFLNPGEKLEMVTTMLKKTVICSECGSERIEGFLSVADAKKLLGEK